MKPIKIEVEWIDSGAASGGGWKLPEEHMSTLKTAMGANPAISRGFIFGVDDENLYVAQTFDPGFKNFLNAQAIYRQNIVRVNKLKKFKKIQRYLNRIQKKDRVTS